jgi:RNA polymerase sigma factor (sigma-70 family)
MGLCLSEHGVIRVPAYTAERLKKLAAETAAFRAEEGREPTAAELAERTEWTAEKVAELLALNPDVTSLDIPVGERGEDTIGTLLPGDESGEPQAELIRRELKELLDSLMGELTDRQRSVLRLRFGMDDGISRSLEQVAKKLAISKERVRQIEKQAMEKMQKIQPAMAYISQNFNKEITNDTLAALTGLSTVYFRKLFTQMIGVSPIAYVHQIRIQKAKEMLKSDYSTLSDIAQSLGYPNLYDFSRTFKKHVGVAPSKYEANLYRIDKD